MTNTQTLRSPRRGIDYADLRGKVAQWLEFRKSEKQAKRGAEKLRDEFKGLLENHGAPDDNGSLFIELQQPVGPIVALKNQKSTRPTFNEEAAVAILQKKGLYQEPYVVMTPVIDVDAIRGAVFEKLLTKSESSRIFGTDVSFSFVALDENGKIVSG